MFESFPAARISLHEQAIVGLLLLFSLLSCENIRKRLEVATTIYASRARVSYTPGWQEVVLAMENSSYFESLEAKAKERYREKLSCVGLSIEDDPYLPTNDARFVQTKTVGTQST